jgi:hypothetical protein
VLGAVLIETRSHQSAGEQARAVTDTAALAQAGA